MNGKASILFVDDEKRVLNSMRGLFRRDFELFLTTEGADAVKIAAENPIDVIVADQRMPGMSGTEVLGKIKQLSPRTVRILLTGYADPSAVEGSINIGEVFRFLSKPCPPKLLRETLELAISAARATPASSNVRPSGAVLQPAAAGNEHKNHRDEHSAPPRVAAPADDPPVLVPVTRARPAAMTPEASAVRSATTDPGVAPREARNDESSSHWQSVTEVVLSGDTSQEVRQIDIESHGAGNSKIVKDVGVVFFTVDSVFAETAMRAVSSDRSTVLATTLVKVAQAIEQQHAGVLVTDFTTNSAVLQKMIGALKQHLPELVTIVISGSRDTTDMINLINYGQVFRYILKPVEPDRLRQDINAAAIRHLYLLDNPELVKRHQVVNHAGPSEASPTLNQFLNKVRNLQSRRSGPTDTST